MDHLKGCRVAKDIAISVVFALHLPYIENIMDFILTHNENLDQMLVEALC